MVACLMKKRESYIRWQGRVIEQLGYAINLILGMSVASIGFGVGLYFNYETGFYLWRLCFFRISLIALTISVAVGLWCVITRLRDFRLTAKIALKRERKASPIELQFMREESKKLGARTWILFFWQIWSFAIGVLILIGVVSVDIF